MNMYNDLWKVFYVDHGERRLPKPVMDDLVGDSASYQIFVRQFSAHIAKMTHLDEVRLLLLLQHCESDVCDKETTK